MRAVTRAVALVGISVLVSYGSASAATLTTPLLFAANGLVCIGTNLGKKPLTVVVTVTDATGAALAPSTDTCNGTPLAPKASCSVVVNSLPPAPLLGGFCSFTAGGKFRGVGYGATATTDVAFPATK